MKEKNIVPPQPPRSSCYLIALDGTKPEEILPLTQELRAAGISCEFSLKAVNVGKQLKNANSARSSFALFVGGDESRAGMVKVKNMATGSEILIPRQEIVGRIAGMLDNK
jgi:histidyl-tRNA synthetase